MPRGVFLMRRTPATANRRMQPRLPMGGGLPSCAIGLWSRASLPHRGRCWSIREIVHRMDERCDRCQQKVKLGHMRAHDQSECPERRCICTYSGCAYVGPMQDFRDHFRSAHFEEIIRENCVAGSDPAQMNPMHGPFRSHFREWLGADRELQLIYSAEASTYSPSTFHAASDGNRDPTGFSR